MQEIGKAALLMISRDSEVQHATKLQLQYENLPQRKKFKLITITQKAYSTAPEASRKILARMVKKEV